MKILYIGNFTQKHCTEVHLAATLRDLGHEVIEHQEGTEGTIPNDALNSKPDMVLWTRTWRGYVTNEFLEYCKSINLKTVSYHLDLYVGLKREDGLDDDPFWRTDFVFTPDGDPKSAKVFDIKGINHFYIPPGVYKPECTYGTPRDQFKYDVIFVGGGRTYHPEDWPYRMKLLNWLEKTYGDRYKKYGFPEGPTIRNEELNDLYASAKVVVGDSLCKGFTHENYWSDRVFETTGRGGFIIHPYIKGLEDAFKLGGTTTKSGARFNTEQLWSMDTELIVYDFDDFEGLRRRIDYFIANDDVREIIRKKGHERTRRDHTYHQRMIEMLKTVNKPKTLPEMAKIVPEIAEPAQKKPIKINLGAGTDIKEGYVNVDLVPLEGIDTQLNLMDFPWPFEDNSAEEIRAIDIVEHLNPYTRDLSKSTIIAFLEECHRILQKGGTLFIQTPRYDADFLWIDPTHVRGFHEQSFDFFDPNKPFGKTTGFYSKCRFDVKAEVLENKNLRFWLKKL